jgi:Na+/proline symporter/signal transduction histidine kinase
MNSLLLSTIAIAYLLLLFLIAWLASRNRQIIRGTGQYKMVFAMAVSVYCTAWTFYGSVGLASETGAEFLAVYIGPLLMVPLWPLILRKIIRISKLQQLTSVADFISARYGKNITLGSIITIFTLMGIIPYLSLQLKAISDSFNLLTETTISRGAMDYTALVTTLVLAAFTLLFGTRKVAASEQNSGLMLAVAFESLVKLLVFLIAGIVITHLAWSKNILTTENIDTFILSKSFKTEGSYSSWCWVLIISGIASTLLPRQFHIYVVENNSEHNLSRSMWVFPLYLLLINLFVIPVAIAGATIFTGTTANPDYYLLSIPALNGMNWLSVLVFIGGVSAATSMVIVETIALSNMFSNNLIMPFAVRRITGVNQQAGEITLWIRRVAILIILLSAYLYYEFFSHYFNLVSIGLISFVAISQFAPAIFGGVLWKTGNRYGAISGIVAGFIIWLFTLVIPSMIKNGWLNPEIIEQGYFGIASLKPYSLFGIEGYSPVAHAAFWSLSINTLLYTCVSLFTQKSSREESQAELFVNIYQYSEAYETTVSWKGKTIIRDLQQLLSSFTGESRAQQLIRSFMKRHQIEQQPHEEADARVVAFVEHTLSGIVGNASASLLVASLTKDENIKHTELIHLLRESQQLITLNHELTRKTKELNHALDQLEGMNKSLLRLDELKDDFLTTVTHELRTPVTSIRAFAEILYDNRDMEEADQIHHLGIIVRETERITRLITQLLDLEKYESGKQKLALNRFDISEIIRASADSLQQQFNEKKIRLNIEAESAIMIADEDKITQVLLNLISNALKHTPSETGIVTISGQAKNGQYITAVIDNGKGIEPAIHELIFEKFYQAEHQTIRKPKGSGLGLAICKKIIQLHEGEIKVKSESGAGSTFTFQIPLTPTKVNEFYQE